MNVILTGATGFLGEYLLVELLERGHTVWGLYRSDHRRVATLRFLSSLGLPRATQDLHWIRGDILNVDDLWDEWCRNHPGLEEVDTILHSAASTRLFLDETGEPMKTNVGGAQALARLVQRRPLTMHLISTAYVCGFQQGNLVRERFHPPGNFVTIYEESKWEAEEIWKGKATILRPGIVVGHSETGRCTSFNGWYITFQAAYFHARMLKKQSSPLWHKSEFRLPIDPDGVTNIVPVDYVARAAVHIIENPENHYKVFHLTHPAPPSHRWTADYITRRLDLGKIELSGSFKPLLRPRNAIERAVWEKLQYIRDYLANNPIFERINTDRTAPDIPVPPITTELVDKVIDYALARNWE